MELMIELEISIDFHHISWQSVLGSLPTPWEEC